MYQCQPWEHFGTSLRSILVFAAALPCCGRAALTLHLSEACMLSVSRQTLASPVGRCFLAGSPPPAPLPLLISPSHCPSGLPGWGGCLGHPRGATGLSSNTPMTRECEADWPSDQRLHPGNVGIPSVEARPPPPRAAVTLGGSQAQHGGA